MSRLILLGTAGGLTFGGKAGIGVGVDAGVVTRVTQAYVGANADLVQWQHARKFSPEVLETLAAKWC